MKHATAEEVRVLLRKRYAAPEWSLLEEVRNHTGFSKQERYADAVAMNLYPSRGLEVLGFEIKVHRGDWLNELRNPDKSASIQKYCVAVDTPVLRSDLRWTRAGDVVVGDSLVGFDEDVPSVGSSRRLLPAVVDGMCVERKDVLRIYLASGETLVCTPEHRWLCRSGGVGRGQRVYWMTARDMEVRLKRTNAQLFLPRYFRPWSERRDYDAGFLSAAFDSEGCLAVPRNNWRLDFSQNRNALLETVSRLLQESGYAYAQRAYGACARLELSGGVPEIWRFLGEMRPPRQLVKFNKFFNEQPRQMRTRVQDRVVAVEHVGFRDVAVMSTTTKTFIANGYASHNCDKWWVVAGGSNTVKVEELPPTWGLMVMGLNRFAIVKDAPKLEAQPLDRGFVASVLRREHNARVSEQAQDAAYQRGKADGITESKARDFHDKRSLELAHEQLSRMVKRFEEKTGIRVNGYDGEHLGDLIALARELRGQRLDVVSSLERAAHPLRMTLKLIDSMKLVADLTSNPDAPGLPMLP